MICDDDPFRRRPVKSTARQNGGRSASGWWKTGPFGFPNTAKSQKIELSDGYGGETISTVVKFGYSQSGFGGYLGNVGLISFMDGSSLAVP